VPATLPSPSRTPLLLRCAALTGAVVAALGAAQPAAAARNPAQTPLPSWQVLAPGWTGANKELGRVNAILRVGRTVYVAGNFTVMANHAGSIASRWRLAAVSAGSGKLQRRFHPLINGRVYSLAVSPGGRFLFVAGQFSAVGVHPRHNLAAFNLRTGRLAKKLPDLGITGTVRTVAVSATGRVYLGGTFGRVAGSRRANLAKLVLRRNRYALNRRWVPSTNGEVRDILLDARAARVVVGGGFTRVNGLGGQTSIAALGPARGLVRPWPSHPRALILDLALCGNRIYAAEGGPGGTALAYGLKGHLKWYYVTDGNVQAAACVSHRPVFGMHGDYVAPHRNQKMSEHGSGKRIQRHKLFMLTRRGVLERWNPDLSSTAGVLGVWSLAVGGGNLYVGGDFTGIHGRSQQRFAILPHG
jgi:hypothetical protein